MRLIDIDATAIRNAIQRQAVTFRTMDISTDPEVQQAHAQFDGEHSRHSMIGRYLSRYRATLSIELVDHRHGNAEWRRV